MNNVDKILGQNKVERENAKELIKKTIDANISVTKDGYGCIFEGLSMPRFTPWEDRYSKRITDNTFLSEMALYNLEVFAKNANELDGRFVEIGSWKGGSAKVISDVCGRENFICCDTFEGIQGAGVNDTFKDGDLATKISPLFDGLTVVKGDIRDKIKEFPHDEIAFLHIDVDTYEITKFCLEEFFQQMVENGIIIVDDYGCVFTQGAKKAVDEFCSETYMTPIALPTGQGLLLT